MWKNTLYIVMFCLFTHTHPHIHTHTHTYTHSHTHTLFPVTQSDLSSLVFTVPCTQLYKYILLKQKRTNFATDKILTTDAKNLDAGSNRRGFFKIQKYLQEC